MSSTTTPSSVPMPLLEGVTHREVEAGGVRFHVAEAGEGDPVVLLHGWPQHWWTWRKLIPLLAADRRVIVPDLRGFGWSEAPPGRYDKATFATDTIAILDALGLERVDLVAHDWGAWAGFILALDHPERIRTYLALSMVTPWPDPPSAGGLFGVWRIWFQFALATPVLGSLLVRRTNFVRRLITTAAVHPDAWTDEDLQSFQAPLREPGRTRATVALYRTFVTRELPAWTRGGAKGRRLTVPTVLMVGTKDPALDHRRLGDWSSNADDMTVELREDSGHFIPEEIPEAVAEQARRLSGGR
jgi:pimeloyl-ACP methyl ester carboxylesterase